LVGHSLKKDAIEWAFIYDYSWSIPLKLHDAPVLLQILFYFYNSDWNIFMFGCVSLSYVEVAKKIYIETDIKAVCIKFSQFRFITKLRIILYIFRKTNFNLLANWIHFFDIYPSSQLLCTSGNKQFLRWIIIAGWMQT